VKRSFRGRILVAEDNPVNRRVALGQLRKLGFSADAVTNGLEALEAFARTPYDAVLMDCQMPEMDGYEATGKIRGRENAGRRTPIIAMTAHAMSGDREKCIAAGMDDYVSKPMRIEELEAALDRCVSRGSAKLPEPLDAETLARLRDLRPDDPDGELAELAELFLESAPELVSHARRAFEESAASVLAREAHTLKSSSGTIGARRLEALCVGLERVARAGKIGCAPGLLDAIDAEMHRVSAALDPFRRNP
jgi:CheY-like chemotaxis protein/HPt (histidine-containing phosphotransfer) domain-containing protein